MTTHIPLHGSGTLPPLFYAERERGAGGAALPGRMRTKNAVIRILLPGWCFFGVFDSFFSQTSMDGLIVTPNCCIF